MTNITLSMEEVIYRRMRAHSEIKWSEYVRKIIKKYLDELETLETKKYKESAFTMLASQEVLKKDWDNKLDERWDDV